MRNSYQFVRKSYAMQRMAESIERAIRATTSVEKERAARWAAAWGVLCGIMTATVNVRRSDVNIHDLSTACPTSELIDTHPRTVSAARSAQLHAAAADANAPGQFDYASAGRHAPAGEPAHDASQQAGS